MRSMSSYFIQMKSTLLPLGHMLWLCFQVCPLRTAISLYGAFVQIGKQHSLFWVYLCGTSMTVCETLDLSTFSLTLLTPQLWIALPMKTFFEIYLVKSYGCSCCSVAILCPTLCDPMDFSTPSFPVLHHLPEFAQTHVHWVSDAIQPSRPLSPSSPFALSVLPSIRVFPNELALQIRWPTYWSFSFSPSNEYSGLISFRIDWFDLLAVQRTLKSLLQHHSSKASVLRHSAFFMVQLSHSYVTTGKTVVLTIWTFIGKVMSAF